MPRHRRSANTWSSPISLKHLAPQFPPVALTPTQPRQRRSSFAHSSHPRAETPPCDRASTRPARNATLMSLSILSTRTPSRCRRSRVAKHDPPPFISWNRIRDVSLAAAAATILSQVPSAPLDLASKLVSRSPNAPHNLMSAIVHLFATSGWRAFRSLPVSCLKRVPTKALTVALFDLGTQLVTHDPCPVALSPLTHLAIAIPAGALGLAFTFPLHSMYYAHRKGLHCASILSSFAARWQIMFSGALPALLSTPPAVIVDYAVYKHLRTFICDDPDRTVLSLPPPVWIVAAATAANLTGGLCVEPLKALSRRMAVDSVKAASCYSMSTTARSMLQGGVGEFWRGYRRRMVRYAVSAVVSKTAVRQLRRRRSSTFASRDQPVMFAAERLVLPAYMCASALPKVNFAQRAHRIN